MVGGDPRYRAREPGHGIGRARLGAVAGLAVRGGTILERGREEVLDAARPLPPDEDVLIGDLTEEEDRLFLGAIMSA
jgi:hypothetical protein